MALKRPASKAAPSGIRIAKRYVRSVDLARDLSDPHALEGYVVTPSVRDASERILAGLARSSTQRAFRVTGPYGAGKSAFALFLARIVTEGAKSRGPSWKLLLDSRLDRVEVPPYIPLIVVGGKRQAA
jgi:predicted NACHT family NTPase